MWDLAQADKGALHALLSVAELKIYALTGGINTVRYCNNVEKIIDAIKDYLSDASTTYRRQVLTMLISTQVSRAVGEEDYETAKMHMKELRKFALRYPPWAESHGQQQQRQLDREGILFIYTAINDTRLASTTCETPLIQLEPARLLERTPINLLNEARQRTMITLKYLPSGFGSSKPYSMISELHQLSLALNPQYAQDLYLTAFFNISAQTLNRHCEMAAKSRHRALSNIGKFILPSDAFALSMLLSARSCLPTDLPSTRRPTIEGNIEVILIGYLFQGLSPAADLLTSWTNEGASLESLVWVLFLGASTGLKLNLDNLPWFLDGLIRTLCRLEIHHLVHFEQSFKIFPWTVPYFGQNFRVLGERLRLDTASMPSEDTLAVRL
ncbi:hypothetical protein BDV97DRAFT_65417 [Delphinella strobiligena]|nr:hypothetical protein BDV97DRAFT_65417 [Delphinella strobiligena]